MISNTRFLQIIPVLAGAALTVVVVAHLSIAGSPPSRSIEPDPESSAEYLEALQAADAFLWAWINRDADEGLGLLSDRLRKEIHDESRLQDFMTGLSNPHHQAFEISRAPGSTGSRYVFTVTLYEFYTGEPAGFKYVSTLEVIKQGELWRIDRLPRTSDNPE